MLKIEPRGYELKFWRYASPILALLLTGATSGLIFVAMGRPAGLTVYTFLIAPLLQQDGFQALVVKAAPLIMMGVGLSLAYRANVWNIGTDGQFTLGAICGGGVALAFPDAPASCCFPRWWSWARIGGMVSGGLVAWLRIRFNANEILTSLMFAYITQYLLVYLVTGPWRDPEGFGFPQTALFSDNALAPRLIEDTNVHIGVVLAPLIAISPVVHAGEIAAGVSVPRAGPGDAGGAVCRVQREPAGLDCDADQRRAGRAGGGAGGDGNAGTADHDAVAGLRVHRDHRGVSWPAQSAGGHSGGAAAGADIPGRRCGADQSGAAERGDRDFPGHPAVLPAGLRHSAAEPDPVGLQQAKAAR